MNTLELIKYYELDYNDALCNLNTLQEVSDELPVTMKSNSPMIEATIPFSGYYETDHGYRLDMMQADDEGNEPEELDYTQYEADKKEYTAEHVHKFFNLLKRESGVDVDYDAESIQLESPMYYNYTTDRIFVKVSLLSMKELYKVIDKDILAKTIKEMFTSRDGFSSFYSPDINDLQWLNIATWDHNQLNALLYTAVEQYDMENDNYEFFI